MRHRFCFILRAKAVDRAFALAAAWRSEFKENVCSGNRELSLRAKCLFFCFRPDFTHNACLTKLHVVQRVRDQRRFGHNELDVPEITQPVSCSVHDATCIMFSACRSCAERVVRRFYAYERREL
eukprot:1824003-Amphidinium_carterae.1